MPRAKQQTTFLGDVTVKILHGVPVEQAGWLIKALVAWIEDHHEPVGDEIPPECLGSWIAIRDESVRIHETRKQQAEAGSKGGKANGKRTASEPEANIERTETKSNRDNENENSHSCECSFSAPAPAEEVSCPADEATIAVRAKHIGMTDAELDAWRAYYTMRDWKADPRSPRPMTPAATLASLRRWHANEGIRAARDAAGRRDPSRYAPPPEKGGIDTAALGI